MDLEKELGGSEPHKIITCSGLSVSPLLLVTDDRDVNSEAQKDIVISHEKGVTYGLSLTIVSRAKESILTLLLITRKQCKRDLRDKCPPVGP